MEYESQHLPLSKIPQSCRFAYTSTIVRIWVLQQDKQLRVGMWFFFGSHPRSFVIVGGTSQWVPIKSMGMKQDPKMEVR
jgi:hypothetical protein